MTDLPTFARDILSAVPHRGDGLNTWLMSASLALRRARRSDSEIIETLRCVTAAEPVKPGEIERAVVRSVEYMADGDGGTYRPTPAKWPAVDKAARAKVIAQYDSDPAELWERSPHRFDDDEPLTETIVDTLFPGNPLICTAKTQYESVTAPREDFRGKLSRLQFIVPSAMTKLTGLNQDGEVSTRCLDNSGPRQYLIVEQDAGTADEQASIIMHLAERAPLVLVVRSGGKSLHSWFACGTQSELTILCFFRYAVTLGADRAIWTRCQLVRMPDGTRHKNGKAVRQAVLYWNPGILGAT